MYMFTVKTLHLPAEGSLSLHLQPTGPGHATGHLLPGVCATLWLELRPVPRRNSKRVPLQGSSWKSPFYFRCILLS